jgi:Nucleotidyltransferase domain
MVKEKDRHVIERFKNLMLERGVPLHRVVLFGSRARGDEEEDSDYDSSNSSRGCWNKKSGVTGANEIGAKRSCRYRSRASHWLWQTPAADADQRNYASERPKE